MTVCITHLPSDVLSVVESFLTPLSLTRLECTCFSFRCRFPALRWEREYYEVTNPKCKKNHAMPTEFYMSTGFDKFVVFLRIVQGAFLGEYDTIPTTPTVPLSKNCNPYKTAVLLSSLGHPTQRCNICGLISLTEVWTAEYIRPCDCETVCVHRSCLEEVLRSKKALERGGVCVDEGIGAVGEVYGRSLGQAAGCTTCGVKYRVSFRLPSTLAEICSVTLEDEAAKARFLSVLGVFAVLVLVFVVGEGIWEGRLRALGAGDVPFLWWQMQQTTMLHIMFSSRFSEIVARLWRGPIFVFYCRLYLYFVGATVLLWLTTSSWVYRLFSILGLGGLELKESLSGVMVWKAVGVFNFWLYFLMSHTVIVIFWRTNYRIYTVMDKSERGRAFDGGSGGVGVLGF
ncbi:hypothetical protein TrST_g9304 [Triparma strigata]|uniref:F-box domain-containing protein n=1 Tax=Triparma strigata TaxID=1606541 RepID=A0A9W7C309_9STRA|nr:hypothetical protein TrST_g9304 [Triparma strigata]